MRLGRAVEPENPAGVERGRAVAAFLAGLHDRDPFLSQHDGVHAVRANGAINRGGGFGNDDFILLIGHRQILPSLGWTQYEPKKIGKKCKGFTLRVSAVGAAGYTEWFLHTIHI